MRRALILTLLLLAACSSSAKKTETTTTSAPPTSAAPTSTAPASSTTTSTTAPAPSTSVPKATTTTTTAHTSGVRIISFTGPSTVSCNAPTSVQLKWSTSGATRITLLLDGQKAASFTKPSFDGLQYFPCDGKPHAYSLVATGPTGTARRTIAIRS